TAPLRKCQLRDRETRSSDHSSFHFSMPLIVLAEASTQLQRFVGTANPYGADHGDVDDALRVDDVAEQRFTLEHDEVETIRLSELAPRGQDNPEIDARFADRVDGVGCRALSDIGQAHQQPPEFLFRQWS